MVKHIASWSGGKDSTYMVIRMLEKGMKIDEIVFCEVIAYKDGEKEISAELPEMYEYIYKFERFIGRKIIKIRADHTFEEKFFSKYQKGKNEGRIYGWPYTLGAWCNSRLKMKALDKYFNAAGNHIRYIGIAYDEPERYARLEKNEKAPMVEWKVTEREAREYLEKIDLLNPLYKRFDRLGCWFCPKQPLDALREIRKNNPKEWNKMLEWDKYSPVKFKPNYTLRQLDNRFRIEDKQGEQVCMFG